MTLDWCGVFKERQRDDQQIFGQSSSLEGAKMTINYHLLEESVLMASDHGDKKAYVSRCTLHFSQSLTGVLRLSFSLFAVCLSCELRRLSKRSGESSSKFASCSIPTDCVAPSRTWLLSPLSCSLNGHRGVFPSRRGLFRNHHFWHQTDQCPWTAVDKTIIEFKHERRWE